MTDNHNADQGQSDYEKRHSCPMCGGIKLELVDWCENDSTDCTPNCPSYSPILDCPMCMKKVKCNDCGHTGDEE